MFKSRTRRCKTKALVKWLILKSFLHDIVKTFFINKLKNGNFGIAREEGV